MPLERALKRGSVRKFDESYQLGFKSIFATEVDDDLDLIFDAWNTIGPSAPTGVAGGVLGGTYPNPAFAAGAILNADVNAAADINGSKLLNLSIPPGKIVALGMASAVAVASLVGQTIALVATVNVTGLGGPVLLIPGFLVNVTLAGGGPSTTLTWTIQRTAPPVSAVITSVLSSASAANVPMQAPMWLDTTAPAAALTYTYNLSLSAGTFNTTGTPGSVYAKELIK